MIHPVMLPFGMCTLGALSDNTADNMAGGIGLTYMLVIDPPRFGKEFFLFLRKREEYSYPWAVINGNYNVIE